MYYIVDKRTGNPSSLETTSADAARVIPDHEPGLRDNYAAAGINLNFPIFEGMLFSTRETEAQLRAQAASENLRDLENNVPDARIAELNLNYATEQVVLTEAVGRTKGRCSLPKSLGSLSKRSLNTSNTTTKTPS